jgi:hypothetical protein
MIPPESAFRCGCYNPRAPDAGGREGDPTMNHSIRITTSILAAALMLAGCASRHADPAGGAAETASGKLMSKYTTVRLTTDLDPLTDNERQVLPPLIEAAQAMNEIFWLQAYGDGPGLLASVSDPQLRSFAEINYGPWDRLDDNAPFIEGVGPKPDGAAFYPADMTKEEFEAALAADPIRGQALKSLFTMVRRNEAGELEAQWYNEAFPEQVARAVAKLREAASLTDDDELEHYLELRADALLKDNYFESDMAWMSMKNNTIDVVIGPIETYEDQLFGYKAAAEAYVLVKDKQWSARLERYASFLPALQRGLPVPEEYKQETPGSDADLNAYDVVYYAGDCNAGSKTIAINLPNDERVQLQKGTRRLQLKNAMRAKFDKILVPISGMLIAEDQRKHITFDAFFANTMFHEVAHGLGIKNTISGNGTVRQALKAQASALEEGKADILGLYMIRALTEQGEMDGGELHDNYVTFMASVFRSIRFGASSAHGRANLARFNFFREQGAFTRNDDGIYSVEFERLAQAMAALSEKILRLQGDGDYDAVVAFMEQYATMDATLESDLERLASAGISVDIVFEQGVDVLGL